MDRQQVIEVTEPTLKQRFGRWLLRKLWRPARSFLAVGGPYFLAEHWLGFDPNTLVTVVLVGSPVLAVGVVVFVRWAWAQNSALPSQVGQVDAEPAQAAGQVAGQAAGQQATVTAVNVLPLPDQEAGRVDDQTEPLAIGSGDVILTDPALIEKAAEAIQPVGVVLPIGIRRGAIRRHAQELARPVKENPDAS